MATTTSESAHVNAVPINVAPIATTGRLLSLDILRGITIAGMILVNDPGTWDHIYTPLEHAEWNGWTPTDLVFPFFLFMVGVSMIFSFSTRIARGATRRELLLHTFRRSLLIYGIGLGLHLYPFFPMTRFWHVRIMGVLARIALCYLLGALVYLYTSRRMRAVIIVALLVGYWAMMRFIPVPGFGAGQMTPEGSLASYVDRMVLGTSHLWRPMWDPEGLLSSVPAIATVLLGCFCGEWMKAPVSTRSRIAALLGFGLLGMGLAGMIHPYFPINKNLWTSTFVIFTAGFCMVFLAVLHWVIDIKGWKAWSTPFQVFGANAILAYSISTLLSKQSSIMHVGGTSLQGYVYTHWFEPFGRPNNASLAYALVFVAINWAIMWWFYKKKIFLKV